MSNLHVVFGAGPVGSATAIELADRNHEVRVITRRGSGPSHPGIELVAADLLDPTAATAATSGAHAVYNCVNPSKYTTWAKEWPPMAAAFITVAEATGAVLVTMSNLYGYGPVDHPMRETDALRPTSVKGRIRASMWHDVLAAHDAGRIRATEARAADFYGPAMTAGSYLGQVVLAKVAAGKTVMALGDPGAPHSHTYVPDVARSLATLGTDERALGRAWHVPSAPPQSVRQIAATAAELRGKAVPKVVGAPRWLVRVAAVADPGMRGLAEMYYQWDRPFELDTDAFTATFGGQATALVDGLRADVGVRGGELMGDAAQGGGAGRVHGGDVPGPTVI